MAQYTLQFLGYDGDKTFPIAYMLIEARNFKETFMIYMRNKPPEAHTATLLDGDQRKSCKGRQLFPEVL